MFENPRDPGLSREFVGAWMVTLVVGVFGLIVTSHHVPDVRDRVVVTRPLPGRNRRRVGRQDLVAAL